MSAERVAQVTLNGEPARVPEGATVSDLVLQMGLPPERVAVEVDGAIVRKADYATTRIAPGARIEVVSFVGGG